MSATRSINFAPLIGNYLKILTSNNKHQVLLNKILDFTKHLFEEYRTGLKEKIRIETK